MLRLFQLPAPLQATTSAARVLLLAGTLGLAPPGTALAAGQDEYLACTTLAQSDPEAAFERAGAWKVFGGGAPARHCEALALFGLGAYAEAGRRLEGLAQDMVSAPSGIRAEVLAQAGQAWIAADQFEQAYAVLSAALELDPDDAEILIDRSQALAGAKNYWEAVDDLNRALELAPDNVEALVFRASAYRFLDALELAATDAEQALSLDPRNADARLERGNIRRLRGDAAGARADWLAVLLDAPDSSAAQAARINLEKLDLKTEPSSTNPSR